MTDPAPEIPLPLPTDYEENDPQHVAHHNKLSYEFNRLMEEADGSAFADIGTYPNVDPTGATECATGIQDALNSIYASGKRAYGRGIFKIASTVTIAGNADMADALFNYTGTNGAAVVIGTRVSGEYIWHKHIVAPRVICVSKTLSDWSQVANTIGIDVCNVSSSYVEILEVIGFETPVQFYGKGTGNVHNTVVFGRIYNGKKNLLLLADATGWVNQNVFIGGRFGHDSSHGVDIVGVRHIEMGVTSNAINSNTWIAPSVEGDTPQFHVVFAGYNNLIINGRWESTGGGRVYWQNPSGENRIIGGYGARFIVEDSAVGAGLSNVIEAATRILKTGSASPEGAVTAPPGTIYTNHNGGAGVTFWVKETGVGNTGWVAK